MIRKVGIVLFNSTVQLKGDFSKPGVMTTDDFNNFQKLFNYAKLKATTLMSSSLKGSFALLKHKILELEHQAAGSTALGPGLVCSLGLASQVFFLYFERKFKFI